LSISLESAVKDAYPSVRRGHANELAVLSKWTLDALFPSREYVNSTPKKAAQQALPQGMSSSPKVLSALVGQVLAILPEQLVRLNYSDDLLIGAKTMGELEEAVEVLEKHFASMKSGPLHFGKIDYVDLSTQKGIKFLGYLVTVDGWTNEIRIRPAPKTFDKHWRKQYHAALEKFEQGLKYEVVFERVHKACESWLGQFPLWKPNVYSRNMLETRKVLVVHDAWTEFNHKKTFGQ